MSALEFNPPPPGLVLSRRRFLEASAAIAGAMGLNEAASAQAGETKPAEGKAAKAAAHPLDPLTAEEMARAVEIVRMARSVDDQWRFVTVTLSEPAKSVVRNHKPGAAFPRKAFV